MSDQLEYDAKSAEQTAAIALKTSLELSILEKKIIKIQRMLRGKIRQREEQARLADLGKIHDALRSVLQKKGAEELEELKKLLLSSTASEKDRFFVDLGFKDALSKVVLSHAYVIAYVKENESHFCIRLVQQMLEQSSPSSNFTPDAITAANTPYRPQCEKMLAKRIIKAASRVKLFSTIKHLTTQRALTSIFDNSLYGRKNLNGHNINYDESAYGGADGLRGDGNAICFGAQYIDPKIFQKTFGTNVAKIILDLNKLAPANPCIFYKQKDFGYSPQESMNIRIMREVTLPGGVCLKFSHHTNSSNPNTYIDTGFFATVKFPEHRQEGPITVSDELLKVLPEFPETFHKNIVSSCCPAGSTIFGDITTGFRYELIVPEIEVPLSATVADHELMASDFAKMHQILTLNFFRFIDNAHCDFDTSGRMTKMTKDSIYKAISQLSDDALVEFLTDVGRKVTDTMEFNFAGAYSIEFPALVGIEIYTNDNVLVYKFNMASFINCLQEGNLAVLSQLHRQIPELLSSYRFLEHLLTHDKLHPRSIMELLRLRAECQEPTWLPLYYKQRAIQRLITERLAGPEQQHKYDMKFGLVKYCRPWF